MPAIGDDLDGDVTGDRVIETAAGRAAADVELARGEHGDHLRGAIELFGFERDPFPLIVTLVHRDIGGGFGDVAVHAYLHGLGGRLRRRGRVRGDSGWLTGGSGGGRRRGGRGAASRGQEQERRYE